MGGAASCDNADVRSDAAITRFRAVAARRWFPYVSLFLVAFALRAAWVLAVERDGFAFNDAIVYHDTASELDDVRWAAARSRFDPDAFSAPWDGEIAGGSGLAATLTDAQKGFLDGNYANHVLPFGAVPRWLDGGWMGDGAFVHEALTTDWFHVRLSQDIATAKATYSARGRKWPMDDVGRVAFGSLIEARFQLGIHAEHFKDGQTSVTVEEITAADLALGRIRASGEATYLGSARKFRADLVFGREDVNPA